ncbi:hypothetical protein SLA2020_180770 [Shorea laevis]
MKLGSAIASTCLPYTITITHRHLLPLSVPSPHSPFRPSNSLPATMSQFLALTAQGSSPTTAAVTVAATADGSHPLPNPQPWLIVGVGNPGKKYWGTRHIVGFEMVDSIAEAEGIPISSVNFKALFGKGFIGNVPVMLAKPQTYMNLSGESIFDDLDLPFAKLRFLAKGGHGGHNGMRNIIDCFKGSRDFPRLRIGIGRPSGKMDAANFVLHPFTRQEHQELDFTFQQVVETVRILLLEGLDKSATFVNSARTMEQLG